MARATKTLTRKQAARKKEQAAELMDRIGEPDRADEFDNMGVDEYAEQRGLRIANPQMNRKVRKTIMASTTVSKADLQDQIGRAIEVLEDAYTPETSREDLAAAVGQALDILNGEDDEDEDDSGDDDDDDEDDDPN